MATEVFHPVKAWNSWVDGTTYVNVARRGDADNFGQLDVSSGSTLIGQELSGPTYSCYQVHLEFDLTAFSVEIVNDGLYVVDDVAFSWDVTDFTDTQTWTCRCRQNNWGSEGPSEIVHMGSGGMVSHSQFWHWTMADAADDPDAGEAWTNDSAKAIIDSLLGVPIDEGGYIPLTMSFMSARQQTELAPANNESFLANIADATLTITAIPGVRDGEAQITIPAPTLSAVVKPQESASIVIPAPQVSVGNMTGPVSRTVPIPAPTVAATTIRRYDQDELFGFIDDDGRRIGRVV